jgi:hypothetical protein
MNIRPTRRYEKLTAVLGGGFQGCCIALALAERGVPVHLYDRAQDLLMRTAVVNEGKLHLGYVYAGDGGLATARTMIRGALAFAPFVQHHLGVDAHWFDRSTPFTYLIHRDSLLTLDQVARYLQTVHTLIFEAANDRKDAYFGIELGNPLRPWTARDLASVYNQALVVGAFDTPEVAIEPVALARRLRARIAATSLIELRTRQTVRAVREKRKGLSVLSDGPQGTVQQTYRHVVNALWDSRLAIDATVDQYPSRSCLYRLKYGIRARCSLQEHNLPSVTIMLGPFGDLVAYRGGDIYLSWYPVCMRSVSDSLVPPHWPLEPDESLSSEMVRESLDAMAKIVRPLHYLDVQNLTDVSVKGGVIVAWGRTDIDDPASELHRRHEIGVTSRGDYHSVDPGKFTMAPLFATITADRICGSKGQ